MLLRFPLLAALAGLLLCGAASADDQPFLTLDTTDIEPQFGHEFEQDLNWALAPSSAAGVEMQSEIEYGLDDDLQIAGAMDYGWEHPDGFHFIGAGGEMIYRPLNVDFDPLGLAVLVSGAAGSDLHDIEAKLLAQKNFLNDRLRFVVNGGWIGDWQRGTEPAQNQWNSASTLEWAAGLAYSITWTWSACVEFDNDHNFEGLLIDGRGTPDSSVYYAGPSLQYVAHPLTMSVGFQAQLPWAGGGAPDAVRNGFATDAERYQVAFRITRDF